MSFYFSMYGDTMGDLSIYIQDVEKIPLQNGKKIWGKSGNQGKRWHYSNVTITSSSRFKVIKVCIFLKARRNYMSYKFGVVKYK